MRLIDAAMAPIYLNKSACDQIRMMPTIDVVPVVRCRECEKAKPGGSGYVWCGKKAMPLNGFCSEGVCGNIYYGESGQHER